MSAFNSAESPLWRIGLYHCSTLPRARRGSQDAFARRKVEVQKLLTTAGLKLIGEGAIEYSKHGLHGYTYHTGLLQSALVIHTYPEKTYRSVTVNIETCEPVEVMKDVIRQVTLDLYAYYGAKALIRRLGSSTLPLRSKDVPVGYGTHTLPKEYR